MAATALPPTGGNPEPAKTCDATGMIEIHRMFRRGFAEGPDIVRRVAAGDTAHAEVVWTQLNMLSAGLHGHHDGEDQRLWGPLEERAPACTVHVERMKEQHATMLVHLNELDAALPAWRASASPADAEPVLAALDGINAALAEHLPDEEANIVPVMETVITEEESHWFAEHGRRSTPKGQSWYALGLILDSQPDGGTEFLRKNLPAPGRLAWRWIGKRKYEARRAVLEAS